MAESGDISMPVDSASLQNNMDQSPGASLLLVIGEPFSEDHKELILERITKGKCVNSAIFCAPSRRLKPAVLQVCVDQLQWRAVKMSDSNTHMSWD